MAGCNAEHFVHSQNAENERQPTRFHISSTFTNQTALYGFLTFWWIMPISTPYIQFATSIFNASLCNWSSVFNFMMVPVSASLPYSWCRHTNSHSEYHFLQPYCLSTHISCTYRQDWQKQRKESHRPHSRHETWQIPQCRCRHLTQTCTFPAL